MKTKQKIYQPCPELSQSAYISSMQQYNDLHKESIDRKDNCDLIFELFLMIF